MATTSSARKSICTFFDPTEMEGEPNNPRKAATKEVDRYFEEPLLGRDENHVNLWKDRKVLYSHYINQ